MRTISPEIVDVTAAVQDLQTFAEQLGGMLPTMMSVRLEHGVHAGETLRDLAQERIDFEFTHHIGFGIGTKLIMGGDVGYFARSATMDGTKRPPTSGLDLGLHRATGRHVLSGVMDRPKVEVKQPLSLVLDGQTIPLNFLQVSVLLGLTNVTFEQPHRQDPDKVYVPLNYPGLLCYKVVEQTRPRLELVTPSYVPQTEAVR